jgi:hypothetical protein
MVTSSAPIRDATWNDLIGPTRRAQTIDRMNRRCWIGVDDPEPWVSKQVDRECLEMGYVLMAVICPITAPGRDRDAMIVYGSMSAVFDTCGTTMHDFTSEDLLAKNFRGRPVQEWCERATAGLDSWTKNLLTQAFRTQIAQLTENRIERGERISRARNARNAEDYREYIRWRVREGWYYGGLLSCAIVSGVDLRSIPKPWIQETLEASVLAFDIHGSLRHAYEDEIGHTLNYLSGDQHEKVTASLEAYTEILLRIQDTDEIAPADKEFLMRYISGLVVANYGCRRYARTTPIHVAHPDDVAIVWSHISNSPRYRYTYRELVDRGVK